MWGRSFLFSRREVQQKARKSPRMDHSMNWLKGGGLHGCFFLFVTVFILRGISVRYAGRQDTRRPDQRRRPVPRGASSEWPCTSFTKTHSYSKVCHALCPGAFSAKSPMYCVPWTKEKIGGRMGTLRALSPHMHFVF